jgi:cell wall-associated NlpC family hydrolase
MIAFAVSATAQVDYLSPTEPAPEPAPENPPPPANLILQTNVPASLPPQTPPESNAATQTSPAPKLEPKPPVTSPSGPAVSLSAPSATNRVSTIEPAELQEFSTSTPEIKRLILAALELTRKGLRYQYGSDDPAHGGMDCSGTIHHLLSSMGIKNAPRQADLIYRWVWEKGIFHAVNGHQFSSFEFQDLKPGDLLFWTGTYAVDADRDPPISHVMLYLGKEKGTGRRLMFGASEGRTFHDVSRYGVSVFDFTLPALRKGETGQTSSHFLGYGSIPGY